MRPGVPNRRVLIHRPGSLGDTVVALPCLRLIRRTFPDSELRVLTNAPVAQSAPPLFSVLDGSGLIDGYMEYPIELRDPRRLWALARDIRRWRPTLLIYLARRERRGQVWRDAAFFRACGIRDFVGLALTQDLITSRARPDGLVEREAERLARNMAALGTIDLSDAASWDLGLSEADRALPRRLIAEQFGFQPFIVVSIGTKQAANDWGAPNWRALTEQLSRIYPHGLVFVGAECDREASDAIALGLGGRCLNLCGLLTVRESAALIAEASLFVGNDSGPMHLAAAGGTPLVAVFSRLFPPGMWFPLGPRAKMLYPEGKAAAARSIEPARVLEAIYAVLPPDAAARKLAGEL
jgi:ADP-heptose:LPS heptosyltransferase